METYLFQTVYIFITLSIVLALSGIFKSKELCSCRVRMPSSAIALWTTIAITAYSYGGEASVLHYLIIAFLTINLIGNILYSKSQYIGPAFYGFSFIFLFTAFEVANLQDIFNLGLENISMFGALLAIVVMFLKKQEHIVLIYLLSIFIFFITSVVSGMLPLVISSILITVSEVILIYFNEAEKSTPKQELEISYLSGDLYSIGILFFPLILL